jgi:hypothetical protein
MKSLKPVTLATIGALAACSSMESNGPQDLQCTIPSEAIVSGGVDRDGIPALNNPEVVPASHGNFLGEDARVLGVVIDGEARAYPFIVMWWHEIVNDTLGGQRILVSYCPLTGSGIAFDPTVDGDQRSFGVSGLLFENNLIMFDRESESLWNQMSLGAQCGLEAGRELTRLPVVETTWGEWKKRFPNSTIVTTNTGHSRVYGVYPYGDYDRRTNSGLTFPSSPFSSERPPKEPVLGVHDGDDALGFPYGVFEDGGENVAVNETVGQRAIVVTWNNTEQTAVAFDRMVAGQVLNFTMIDPDAMMMTDAETGSTWDVRGEAVGGPLAGERLAMVADAYVVFWFAWSVYYPDTRLAL